MNADKNMAAFFQGEPPGQHNSAIRWLQKKIMARSAALERDFPTKIEWEQFRSRIRIELPEVIGIPRFDKLETTETSFVRGRITVAGNCVVERVDVFVDDDYSIPAFVYTPAYPTEREMPALVWNGGWPQNKWDTSIQHLAVRLARQGFVVLTFDHAPFGETTPPMDKRQDGMTLIMGMGNVLGISQLALRTAETMRCGEYLRARSGVDANRVAVAGLCQGGMDTWLAAALDDDFCAAAPICSESTFTVHFAEMASYRANGDASPFPFGILKVCDVEHLHGCIAPRPLLVRANLPDDWWPVSGFDAVEAFTRKIYRLYKAENRLDFGAEIHEHDITGPFADALEIFLLKYLSHGKD